MIYRPEGLFHCWSNRREQPSYGLLSESCWNVLWWASRRVEFHHLWDRKEVYLLPFVPRQILHPESEHLESKQRNGLEEGKPSLQTASRRNLIQTRQSIGVAVSIGMHTTTRWGIHSTLPRAPQWGDIWQALRIHFRSIHKHSAGPGAGFPSQVSHNFPQLRYFT